MRGVGAMVAVLCACQTAVPMKEATMKPVLSPAGDTHPGTIVHEDRVSGRTWSVAASEVPESVAWARVGDRWEAVVRIEVTGTPDQRRITRYGADGQMLDSTIQAPPPMPPSRPPVSR